MAYSTAHVYAYCNTGFSMINTPATPAVLAGAGTVVDLGEINCLSMIGKKSGSIDVHDFAGIATCDYVKIVFSQNPIDTYWVVTGYDYKSSDTLSISIILDGFLTCGGTAGITSLSGYVKRHTVTDDSYGKYAQIDPLLVPSQNLIFRTLERFNCLTDSDPASSREDCYNIVLSNANILDLACSDDVDLASVFGDISAGESITVPELPPMDQYWGTMVRMGDRRNYNLPCVVAFNYDDAGGYIQNGIARLHALGMDNAIIAMYALPKRYFNLVFSPETRTINGTSVSISDAVILFISDKAVVQGDPNFNISTSVNFMYKTVNNNKALYNGFDTVKALSNCSGSGVDYDILDLYHSGETNVTFNVVCDGRAHGKPYFFPKYYHDKVNGTSYKISFVDGLEWQNVPLQYTYSPGWYKEWQKFKGSTQVQAKGIEAQQEYNRLWGIPNVALDAVGMGLNAQSSYLGSWDKNALGKGQGAYTANTGMLAGQMALGVTKSVLGYAQMLGQQELEASAWARQRKLEERSFLVDAKFSVPDIAFPVAEDMRDFYGNGLIVAFVTPTDADIERFDKILNMYGYLDAGSMLTTADMTAGLYYSYIEATGVQVQTSIAVDRNIREMAEAQIEAGIRIWKAKPDFSKYSVSNRT